MAATCRSFAGAVSRASRPEQAHSSTHNTVDLKQLAQQHHNRTYRKHRECRCGRCAGPSARRASQPGRACGWQGGSAGFLASAGCVGHHASVQKTVAAENASAAVTVSRYMLCRPAAHNNNMLPQHALHPQMTRLTTSTTATMCSPPANRMLHGVQHSAVVRVALRCNRLGRRVQAAAAVGGGARGQVSEAQLSAWRPATGKAAARVPACGRTEGSGGAHRLPRAWPNSSSRHGCNMGNGCQRALLGVG